MTIQFHGSGMILIAQAAEAAVGTPANDVAYAFLSILFEGAFFILIGTVISGFIDAYLPAGKLEKMLPKNKPLAIMVSGLLGAILPVCECAIVPVIRRLVQKGLPLSCAITYMLAAPIVNPVTFFSTLNAFSDPRTQSLGWEMATERTVLAWLITVLVGFIVLKVRKETILSPKVLKNLNSAGDHDHSHGGNKLLHAMRMAQRDFVDVAMYFVVGVAITSVFSVLVNRPEYVAPVAANEWLATPGMMVLAFVLSLCSTTDAFVAAQQREFSDAAKLAFLVYGPMVDVKLLFLYAVVFKRKFVAILAIGLFVLVGVVCNQWESLDRMREDRVEQVAPSEVEAELEQAEPETGESE